MKFLASFIILILIILPNVYAEQSGNYPLKFSGKGMISETSGAFPGMIVWTIINGQSGTFLVHGANGLVVVRSIVSQNSTCDQTQFLCLDTKITLVKNSQGAFKVGDEAKIKIDLSSKQETVTFLSGFFEGVDIPIIFSTTWMPQTEAVSNSTSR